MDYKMRNSKPPIWSLELFMAYRKPEPYDVPSSGELMEVDSKDLTSVFLVDHCFGEEHGLDVSFYAIEAPRSCPLRKAFEWGEISWLDFFMHKEWLLYISMPVNALQVVSKYITPHQIDPTTRIRMEHMGRTFPYELKRQQLEARCTNSILETGDTRVAEREYQNFMVRYGHRFSKAAA
jgi:hypothetical protein